MLCIIPGLNAQIILDDHQMKDAPKGVPKIAGYEYWFNNDFANKISTSVLPTQQLLVSQNIPTTGLINGINIFNFRSYDNDGKYSSTLSQFFYKMPQYVASTQNLVSYEYWFDNNYASAVIVNTPIQHQVAINELIDAQALLNGIHVFNIRFKDNANRWSSTMSQFFYKMPPTATSASNLVSYEYWFDNDYANVVKVNTPVQSQVILNELINAQILTNGIHVFNIRFKDNANKWSSTLSQFFYKMPAQTIVDNLITNYRYWVDADFANAVNVSLQVPVKQISLIDNLDFTQIPKGIHTISFQFKDDLGLWSSVTNDTITKISFPVSDFTYTRSNECDSTVINFINQSVDGDTYLWDFGEGITDTLVNPTHTYYAQGIYNVGLTITDTVTLASSSKLISIFITGNTSNSFSVTTCDSYTLPSGNHAFTTSGIYNDTIPNQWGCDSVLTINVSIKHSTHVTDVISACESYTWIDGITYSASNNTATHTLNSFNGCDSVITLNLTIYHGNTGTDVIISCDSYTWIDGIIYTASNTSATFTLSNVHACDSIVTLNLTINQTPDTSVVQNGITLSAVANVPGLTYRWLNCNNNYAPIQGETGQSFSATDNGSYALEVSKNQCVGVSSCYAVTTVGILEDTFETQIIVYPNPTNGNISLDLGGIYPETLVKIYDTNGKLINQLKFENKNILELYIHGANGIYLIDIQPGSQKALMKVIKN